MRFIIIIMTALLVQASAASLAQKITYVQKNAALSQIFSEIRKQTGYDVLWPSPELDVTQKINANFKNAGLQEVVGQCLAKGKFDFTIEDKTIVIKEKAPSFLDKVIDVISNDRRDLIADISGIVRNERGEPLEGITVMVKGAKTGTRTNAKGEFLLKGVKKGDVLVFTGVAIEPFEYTVKDDKNIDLNLKARLVQLEEVAVNTGYQKISKERYVGSYSQLDSAAFHRRAGMGILERLDGTVTGLLYTKNVGSTGIPPIQVRGLSTFQSNTAPLIIVDNFPYNYNLNTLNPNDVENVTVLKDAAATSIWGARAGNGVIVITTKKGKFNQPVNVTWSSNVSIQDKANLYYHPQISSSDFIDFEQLLFAKNAYNGKLNSPLALQVSPVVDILNKIRRGSLTEAQGKAQIDQLRNVDYRDQLNRYVYQNRIAQQHFLNITGGSGTMNYQLSAGYNRTRPDIQNSKNDDQYTLSSNAGFKAGKKIDINVGFNLSQGNQRSVALPTFFPYPYTKLADENGQALPVTNLYRLSYLDTVGKGKLLDWYFRPLDEIRLADQTNLTRTAIVNAGARYGLTSWLKLELQGQYSFSNTEGRRLNSLETYEARNAINTFTNLRFTDPLLRYPIPMGGILRLSNTKANGYNLRGSVNVNKNWQDHRFDLMLAFDASESKSDGGFSGFYGYQPDFNGYNNSVDYVNNYRDIFGRNSRLPSLNSLGDQFTNRLVSFTTNGSYTYQDKYTVYASARRDGSNLFGVNTNNKWKPLLSIGGSWAINKEKFFQVPWVDQLNLKTTYGYSGNVNNSVNGQLIIAYDRAADEFSGLPTAYKSTPPNPNLRWEEVRMFNAGITFSLLSGRITGSFEYFKKKSTDLITVVPFAPSTGVNTQSANGASLKGDGYDFNFNTKILDNRLKWFLGYGLSHAKMKAIKVFQLNRYLASDFTSPGINPSIGRIVFGLSSYRWAGLDPQNGDPRGYLNGQISKNYGAIVIDSVDKQIFHGSAVPLYSGFLSNRFSWKNISLSFNIGYKLAYYFRKPVLDMSNPINLTFIPLEYNQRWQKPGDEQHTNTPSFVYPSSVANRDQFYSNSEITVFRGDHVRLQDANLQYNVNNLFPRNFFLKNVNASFYLNNINLIIWKKDKSVRDPEISGFSAPAAKTYTIGLTANF